MLELDLTSRSLDLVKAMKCHQMRDNMPSYPVSIINRTGYLEVEGIWRYRPPNLRDLDWPFKITQGQRQWRQMKPRSCMRLSWIDLVILNRSMVILMVILNIFGDMPKPLKTCVTCRLTVQAKVKDNGAKWNLIIFIWLNSYPSSIYVTLWLLVILNRFGDIGHWKPVWPGWTCQGHSRSNTMAQMKPHIVGLLMKPAISFLDFFHEWQKADSKMN